MTSDLLYRDIIRELPFEPNPLQNDLARRLASFVSGESGCDTFILNGYAGTGKTSMGGALIRALKNIRKKTILLAPTGRAAKVAAGMGGGVASTIHRRIYHRDPTSQSGQIVMSPNRDSDSIYIIDEASLISDDASISHSLLRHLIQYIKSRPGNRILFMGDIAQLPPVGQSESKAMNPVRLRELGLSPETFTLDLPERQQIGSGILRNATNFRNKLFAAVTDSDPTPIVADGYDDVEIVSSYDLADTLASSWATVGMEDTIIITRSNKRANNFNNAIRGTVMMAEEPLQKGDRLVISKNDYYWSNINKMKNLLANGETAVVTHVGRAEKMYGRYFTDVDLRIPADDVEISAKLMLRSLVSEGPAVPTEELKRMYDAALKLRTGADEGERFRLLAEDPYLNALQAKYAYCITCHKAQGGQWRHVYIDMGSIPPESMTGDFWRWLYTAVTRTTEKLFFINPTLPVIDRRS